MAGASVATQGAPRAAQSLARLLRRLTGVPAYLLDDVTFERSRYIGMAWTMLGTASLATVGMTILIVQLGAPWPLAVLAALLQINGLTAEKKQIQDRISTQSDASAAIARRNARLEVEQAKEQARIDREKRESPIKAAAFQVGTSLSISLHPKAETTSSVKGVVQIA